MRSKSMGIVVEASHHEVATGQHEIDFRYAEALQHGRQRRRRSRSRSKAIAQQPRSVRDVHAEAVLRHERLRDAHPSEPGGRRYGTKRVPRSRRRVRPVSRGAPVHRGPAGARAGHECHPGAFGQFVQTTGPRLRGPGLHQLGAHQSVGAGSRTAGEQGSTRVDPHRAALPGSELQPVPGVRGDARGRPRRRQTRAIAFRSRSKRTFTISTRE